MISNTLIAAVFFVDCTLFYNITYIEYTILYTQVVWRRRFACGFIRMLRRSCRLHKWYRPATF